MSAGHEHDDDLEPEVSEGAEIETEQYEAPEDEEGSAPGSDPGRASGMRPRFATAPSLGGNASLGRESSSTSMSSSVIAASWKTA